MRARSTLDWSQSKIFFVRLAFYWCLIDSYKVFAFAGGNFLFVFPFSTFWKVFEDQIKP